MSKVLGITVLALGVAGLGAWGTLNNAHRMEDRIEADALGKAATETLPVDVSVSGRDITLSGMVESEASVSSLVAAMEAVPGRRVVRSNLTLPEIADPHRLTVTREGGALTAEGMVASEAGRALLGAELDASGLDLRRGAHAGWDDAVTSGLAGLSQLESGQFEIAGDTLTLTGSALNPAAKDAAIAGLAQMPVGMMAAHDITLLDDGAPFTFTAAKDGQNVSAQGKLGADVDLAALGLEGADVQLSPADRPDGYDAQVTAGLAALNELAEGQLDVDGDGLRLTGRAETADAREAALALLPEGATAEIDAPAPKTQFAWNATSGVTRADNIDADALAAGLRGGDTADLGDAAPMIATLAPWMSNAEAVAFDGDRLDVTVVPGVDVDQVNSALAEGLDAERFTVGTPENLPADGTERVNAITDVAETFTGGFWMTKQGFDPTALNCSEQANVILGSGRVTFLSGSAQLDARATNALNTLASVLRRCANLVEAGIEIGGHTDSTGDAALNEQLSQDRAASVVEALAARGVDATRMTARGYGAALPIADNETEEGRAANRRTTITWAE